MAIACVSRLDPSRTSVHIWDPAAGTGFAGSLLVEALRSAGMRTRYCGQDINEAAAEQCRRRFAGVADVEIALGDTLTHDAFKGFVADLVIVDAPWGMDWRHFEEGVKARQASGSFGFGLPQRSDSTWLFISLALEKLRPRSDGGGRVAALVNPGALSSGGSSGTVRQRIVEAGLLESVTRLPEGLAPNTGIPLYLVTFTNSGADASRGRAMIADLQTQFTTERRHRSMPIAAFEELESALRTGKAGPWNRSIALRQFIRREARLERTTGEGNQISWKATTYNDTALDDKFLASRYGPTSEVLIVDEPKQIVDLDPSRILGDDSREVIRDIEAKGWPARRLSSLISREPESLNESDNAASEGQLYIPTTREGKVALGPSDARSSGRVLSIRLEDELVDPSFLAAWLNSEQGVASRRRTIHSSRSGTFFSALRSDPASLMRWADELIVPVPERSIQRHLAAADERLASFEAELLAQRENIWAFPDSADNVVNRFASAFDDSLSSWLDQLPFPVASALWTAETASTPDAQQRAYIHAWEAIVTFHATVLLSASRTDPGSSSEVEAAIRRTLQEQHLGIERATFGTWVIIIERITRELRRAFEAGNFDDIARVRRSFGDLSQTGIERLISKELVKKFSEVNTKRNRWLGHAGFITDDEWRNQVTSLVADLSELRQILGHVWTQLVLVRAGSSRLRRDGRIQTAELAVGTRSPFRTKDFSVGDEMIDGDLYLVMDGSRSPLRLGQFVQLRAAPRDAQYTTYFYNRTEGANVRMISYQHGPDSEIEDDAEGFSAEFGGLRAPDGSHG